MSAPALVLELDQVSVRFGGITALSNVSIALASGELTGVIGPNGAGKTTLFDVASGFQRPSQGRVRMGGADVSTRSAAWRARHGMARTFQRQQVFGAQSVGDNLRVAIEGDRSYYDTNTSNHFHFFNEDEGRLTDIPRGSLMFSGLPQVPEGKMIDRIDVIVRLKKIP